MMHYGASAERLATLRVVVFAIWFVRIATTPVQQYTQLPSDLIEPVGLIRVLPVEAMLSSPSLLLTLKGLALAGCLACALGMRPWRALAVLTVLLIVWHDGSMKSIQGLVNHGQLAVLYTAFILMLAPAADALSVPRWIALRRGRAPQPLTTSDPWRYGGPLAASALTVVMAYTFIGMRRLIWGGPEVFTDGSVQRWVAARSLQYSGYDIDTGLLVLELPGAGWLLATVMLVATVFEAASLVALWSPRFRLFWLSVMVPFHVSTLFVMNIFFWENLILLAVLLIGVRSSNSAPSEGAAGPAIGSVPRRARLDGDPSL